jgi:hypothetical protein
MYRRSQTLVDRLQKTGAVRHPAQLSRCQQGHITSGLKREAVPGALEANMQLATGK